MRLQWMAQGWLVRLFILYLLSVVCISLIRSIRLAWRLHSFPGRKPVSLQEISDGVVSGEMLAQSALSNKVLWKSVLEAGRRELSGTLQLADSRFTYLWDLCCIDVKSIRRSIHLILLLSSTLVLWTLFPTWEAGHQGRTTGTWALFHAIDLTFAWLGLALFVCSFLYALYSRFEGTMMRRKASWSYLRARLEQHAATQ